MQLIGRLTSRESELTFMELMEILSVEHDLCTASDIIKSYCLRTHSLDIQKKGMEFLYINGYHKELKQLIEKNSTSPHQSIRKWAEVYQIICDRKLEKDPPHIIIRRLDQVRTNDPNLIAVIEVSKVSSFIDMHRFAELGDFLDKYERWFNEIEDSAFLAFLQVRLDLILMYYYLSRNLVILSRRCADRLLSRNNISPFIKLSVHSHLGFSYLFDSYLESMTHMQKALQIAKEHEFTRIIHIFKNKNIPFIAAHFKQVDNMTTTDKSEQAHIEMARGKNERAIEILSEMPLDTPFKLYYMGRAKQDKELLALSASQFIEKRSDYFFSRLPLNELASMSSRNDSNVLS